MIENSDGEINKLTQTKFPDGTVFNKKEDQDGHTCYELYVHEADNQIELIEGASRKDDEIPVYALEINDEGDMIGVLQDGTKATILDVKVDEEGKGWLDESSTNDNLIYVYNGVTDTYIDDDGNFIAKKYDGTTKNYGKVQGRETNEDEKVIVSADDNNPHMGVGPYTLTYSDGSTIDIIKSHRIGLLGDPGDGSDPYDKTYEVLNTDNIKGCAASLLTGRTDKSQPDNWYVNGEDTGIPKDDRLIALKGRGFLEYFAWAEDDTSEISVIPISDDSARENVYNNIYQ